MVRATLILNLLLCLIGSMFPASAPSESTGLSGNRLALSEDPSPVKTPEEEQATFQLEPGLQIQLVAAEPLVQDPVVITFDEQNRLWVVEMRGFMPTIDGEGENQPVGRISILEDRNGDGQMDIGTVYLDSLIMPRAIAPVRGGALVVESGALWLTQDQNNDLRADTKTLIDPDYAGKALPEHAGNGLWRNVDNWYYNAKSRFRYRLHQGKWERDSTEMRGQWGICQDDKGRLIYNYNWSQLHGDLVPPNYLFRNKYHTPTTGIDHGLTTDRRIYPIRPNPAVNRGYIPNTLDKDGRLQEFTAACSPLVYRGTTLPKAFYGNVFVCEPAGNLIKRNVVREDGPLLSASNPNPGREFLASTDERFRPVHLATGPDGALYVADMYRGLIQHGAYITPYLREQTLKRNLVLPINRGRIWRIIPANASRSAPEKLGQAVSSRLVDYLSHPNGWHRDMAQRLLVERNDPSVVPALLALAEKSQHSLGRFHALWTLDGLNQSRPSLLLSLASDPDPLLRNTALRLLEPFARTDRGLRAKLSEQILNDWPNAPAEVVLQMALSAPTLEPTAARRLLVEIAGKQASSALIRDAILSSVSDQETSFMNTLLTSDDWKRQDSHRAIFLEQLATVLMRRHKPAELSSLLAHLDKMPSSADWRRTAVVNGLLIGGKEQKQPVRLPAAPPLLTQSGRGLPDAQRRTLAGLFAWPGHSATSTNLASRVQMSPLSDEDRKLFARGRQHYLTTCAGCHGSDGAGLNRFAPPLIGSDWVLGDGRRLALIVLHGMEGPVDVAGKTYNAPDILPVMPAHSTLDDETVTAILVYIRNEWGNDAGPVGKRLVGMTRITAQGRTTPWTAAELNRYITETKEAKAN
mgnify:CR=1 FL=1